MLQTQIQFFKFKINRPTLKIGKHKTYSTVTQPYQN